MSIYVLPRLRHVWTPIPGYKRSFALLSSANATDIDRAVVFVHGFSGRACSTWADFLSLVDAPTTASKWWEHADLFFYDYHWDSIFQKIGYNSDKLILFLGQFFPKPPLELFETAEMSIRPGFQYKQLTLVGHSEGGLLVRKVILEAANQDKRLESYRKAKGIRPMNEPEPAGLLLAQLRLFAPAIGGKALSGFLGIVASLPIIASALRLSSAMQGLDPISEAVRGAREYTNELARDLDMDCFRAHIVWAEHDAIVDREGYMRDYHCIRSPKGTNHSTVCKPTREYPLPLSFVENGVKNGEC